MPFQPGRQLFASSRHSPLGTFKLTSLMENALPTDRTWSNRIFLSQTSSSVMSRTLSIDIRHSNSERSTLLTSANLDNSKCAQDANPQQTYHPRKFRNQPISPVWIHIRGICTVLERCLKHWHRCVLLVCKGSLRLLPYTECVSGCVFSTVATGDASSLCGMGHR